MKQKGYNRRLQAVYLEVVDNQLRDNDPPETRQTYERLRGLGYGERDAKILIASAIAAETYWIMKSETPHNPARFIRNLHRLPDQSFEE